MNKRELIDAISDRLGDKKTATEALNAVLETIQSAVASGDNGLSVIAITAAPRAAAQRSSSTRDRS